MVVCSPMTLVLPVLLAVCSLEGRRTVRLQAQRIVDAGESLRGLLLLLVRKRVFLLTLKDVVANARGLDGKEMLFAFSSDGKTGWVKVTCDLDVAEGRCLDDLWLQEFEVRGPCLERTLCETIRAIWVEGAQNIPWDSVRQCLFKRMDTEYHVNLVRRATDGAS